MIDELIARLRAGICDDKCRRKQAQSGCMCAAAADALEDTRKLLVEAGKIIEAFASSERAIDLRSARSLLARIDKALSIG